MYVINDTDRKKYELLKERLNELYPEYEVRMTDCDINLERLGFVDSAPCRARIDITEQQYEDLLDELIGFEINAYNNDPWSSDASVEMQLCERYTWMYDYLLCAEMEEEENERRYCD